jgi:hypothetical protein
MTGRPHGVITQSIDPTSTISGGNHDKRDCVVCDPQHIDHHRMQHDDQVVIEEVYMKSTEFFVLSLALTVGLLAGCSGSDNSPAVMSGSTPAGNAGTEEMRVSQSDNLTAEEMAQVDRANSEPLPPPKADL